MTKTLTAVALALALLLFAVALPCVSAFYLPGVQPVYYEDGQAAMVRVNTLRSDSTLVPYTYYHFPFFCRPATIQTKQETLGELLWGDKIMSSLYVVNMRKNLKCKLVTCTPQALIDLNNNVATLDKMINDGYRAHMNFDNLPGYNNGTAMYNNKGCTSIIPVEMRYKFFKGYFIGVPKQCVGQTLVNNHLHFRVQYHQSDPNVQKFLVVGFTIQPFSIKHAPDGGDCDDTFDPTKPGLNPLSISDVKNKVNPFWSYSIEWVNEPNIVWASRWEAYFQTSAADRNSRVHWTYIINSLLIAVALGSVVSFILARALRKDIDRYNTSDPEQMQEEIGWKLVHADVFRRPRRAPLIAVLAGTGYQVLLMAVAALFFALLGFLSPANRGALLTTLILLFVLLAFVAGYVTSRILMAFESKRWLTVFMCGLMLPGVGFFCFVIIDIMDWSLGAATAASFGTILTLFGLWIGVSLPLVVLGASFGFHQAPWVAPIGIGKLPREIPAQKWYFAAPAVYLYPPTIPLVIILMELKFILSSVWFGMVYYVFGFLAVIFCIWVFAVILTTITFVYYQLCYEEYRWQWSSLFIPGGMGLQFYIYTAYYYFFWLDVTSTSGTVIYFMYMALVSLVYGLAAGAVGFSTSVLLVRKMYTSIKID